MSSQVFYDLQLIRFYEEKTKTKLMLGKSEIVSVKKYFPNHPFKDRIMEFCLPSDEFNLEEHPIAIILEMFKDKIYVEHKDYCYRGENLLSFPKGFILYFYSCSQESRDSMIEKISKMYSSIEHENSLYLVIHDKFSTEIDMRIRTEEEYLFETSMKQYGWSEDKGYFCSIVDATILTLRESTTRHLPCMNNYCTFDIVGISYPEYLLFYRCKTLYNLPSEIFEILCNMWLKILVYDGRDRLVTKKES